MAYHDYLEFYIDGVKYKRYDWAGEYSKEKGVPTASETNRSSNPEQEALRQKRRKMVRDDKWTENFTDNNDRVVARHVFTGVDFLELIACV